MALIRHLLIFAQNGGHFVQRTINEWNKLSTDCVTASSVNMFKNKVDTYLRRAGYK